MMQLRDYQQQLKGGIYREWHSGSKATCAVSPTGSGKTVLMGSVAHDHYVDHVPGCVIAHRAELVSQISMALARFGIEHDIIAAATTVKFCISQHIVELGRSYYRSGSTVTVASVDTLKARAAKLSQWFADQRWWMLDECHHLLSGNKWGVVVAAMKNARGLGVTATPIRADRKSLHVDQGGVFDSMVVGPSMRELIERGSLCDYRIFAPPQSIDLTDVKIGSTGDYSQPGLRQAAHKSKVVGDVVGHYKRLADGLRGITFTVDVEQANELADAFNAAGVPALAVSAKTPDAVRAAAVDKLKRGVVKQLVNVDLFGEGFDVPAVEVVSMARPTMSYGLYVQQFGRALRTLDGKSHGIIIDHVGNVKSHGLPDAPREWRLFNEERGKRRTRDEDVIPVASCTKCYAAYERTHKVCPFCGFSAEPEGRSRPEQVDGDLIELDPAVLAEMRGEIERVSSKVDVSKLRGLEKIKAESHNAKVDALDTLKSTIALWAGVERDAGRTDSEIHRRFFFRFGTDIGTAQTLSKADADALREKIERTWL